MQGRDITEANQPFWIFGKPSQIDILQQPQRSISPAGTENGPDIRMIQHGLKVLQPCGIVSCKLVMMGMDGTHMGPESFSFHNSHEEFQVLWVHPARRGSYPDQVTFSKGWRSQLHRIKIVKILQIPLFNI